MEGVLRRLSAGLAIGITRLVKYKINKTYPEVSIKPIASIGQQGVWIISK